MDGYESRITAARAANDTATIAFLTGVHALHQAAQEPMSVLVSGFDEDACAAVYAAHLRLVERVADIERIRRLKGNG